MSKAAIAKSDYRQSYAPVSWPMLTTLEKELLTALKAAEDYLGGTLGKCDSDCECVLHPMRAAIARAEGR